VLPTCSEASVSRIPFKDADEQDALTPWKRYYIWRSEDRDKIKRRYRRRERRLAAKSLDDYRSDPTREP
jgi:hypothetical protein